MNIEEAIEILKNSKKLYLKEKIDSDILEEAIETLLTAYEQKCNYIKENEIYKKNLFNNYEEKCKELEKEKEANKKLDKEAQGYLEELAGDGSMNIRRIQELEAELEKEKEKNKILLQCLKDSQERCENEHLFLGNPDM